MALRPSLFSLFSSLFHVSKKLRTPFLVAFSSVLLRRSGALSRSSRKKLLLCEFTCRLRRCLRRGKEKRIKKFHVQTLFVVHSSAEAVATVGQQRNVTVLSVVVLFPPELIPISPPCELFNYEKKKLNTNLPVYFSSSSHAFKPYFFFRILASK